MKIENGEVVFSSGRRRSANGGVIGLSSELDVSGGWDDGFWMPDGEDWRLPEDRIEKEDLIELADYMIALWTAFRTAQVVSK